MSAGRKGTGGDLWAPPGPRAEYEAALGRFTLAYNQMDHQLTEVIETILRRLGRQDLLTVARGASIATCEFWFRLCMLNVLKSTAEGQGIADVPVKDMRDLASERAVLAHAHMDRNPFDDSYRLISKGAVKQPYTSNRIDQLAAKAERCWEALRHAEAFYDFSDVGDPSPS